MKKTQDWQMWGERVIALDELKATVSSYGIPLKELRDSLWLAGKRKACWRVREKKGTLKNIEKSWKFGK